MKIQHRFIDLIGSFEQFKSQGKCSEINIKALKIEVFVGLIEPGKPYLISRVNWEFGSAFQKTEKSFDYSENGWQWLCIWVDCMRCKFARELL